MVCDGDRLAHAMSARLLRLARVHGRRDALSAMADFLAGMIRASFLAEEDSGRAQQMMAMCRRAAGRLGALDDFEAIGAELVSFWLDVRLGAMPAGGERDLFGRVAEQTGTLVRARSQFFTPSTVAGLVAEMVLGGISLPIARRGWASVLEPACGTGGLVLAADAALRERHGPEIARDVVYVLNDIDRTMATLAWVQCALAGIPAIVICGDFAQIGMDPEAERWGTPALADFYGRHGTGPTGQFKPDLVLANPPF